MVRVAEGRVTGTGWEARGELFVGLERGSETLIIH